MTYFINFIKTPRNAAALVALCAVVLLGVLFLERSFSPILGLQGTIVALADGGGGDGGGGSGGGDGGGGDGGGGCCGGGDGGGGGGDTGGGDTTPPPPPPPPPPPVAAPVCIVVATTPNAITLGQSSTLSWNTANGTLVTLRRSDNQTRVPVGASGSTVVTPTYNTTYIINVSNSVGSVDCQSGVNVTTPPPPPVDMCPNIAGNQVTVPPGMIVDSSGNCVVPPPNNPICTLTSSSASVAAGGTATLTWTSSNATSAVLNPGGTSIAVNGSQVVTVNSNTTYTATFTGSAGSIACTANITVTSTPPPPPPSCTSNCGGGGLNQPNISLFRQPGEQPLAFVTLSSMPYTGYDAGPFGIALFWLLLVVWSAFVAWLIVVKRVPQMLIEKYAGVQSSEPRIISEKIEPMAHVSHIKPSVLAMPRSIMGDRPVPVSRFTSQKMPAQAAPVHAPVEAQKPTVVAHIEAEPVVYAKTPVVLSEDTDYVSAVPQFIAWIAQGHSDLAFNFLRNLKLSQKSAQDFMEKVVCELDDAYRCRIDATVKPDAHTHAALSNLSNAQVETLIDALASAVDRSYGSDFTSAKIALVRALGVGGPKKETDAPAPVTHAPSHHVDIASPQAQPAEKPATRIEAMHEEPKRAAKPAGDYVDDFIMGQINRLRA